MLAGGAVLAVLGLAAAPATADPEHPCFFINQWQGWKAAGPNVIYLRVNLRDIYRVELSAGSQELTWPGSYHLVSRIEGSTSICSPLDLQLAVADGHGFYQPLIVRSIAKLTREQIAALPRKDLP
jgi:hypothetical protein